MPGRKEGKITLGNKNGPSKARKPQSIKWGLVSRAWDELAGGESKKVGWGSVHRGPCVPISRGQWGAMEGVLAGQ